MRIRGKIIFKGKDMLTAKRIALALSPDNLPNIHTEIEGDKVVTTLAIDKIGTLIATVDDYLMNAKIAFDMGGIKKDE